MDYGALHALWTVGHMFKNDCTCSFSPNIPDVLSNGSFVLKLGLMDLRVVVGCGSGVAIGLGLETNLLVTLELERIDYEICTNSWGRVFFASLFDPDWGKSFVCFRE